MKKIIFAMTVLAISMMASVTMGADMIAGNPDNGANVVGTVDVEVIGGNIVVTYTITDDDYHILVTHLAIWEKGVDDGPKVTGGGPPPGLFPWNTPDGGSTDKIVTYTIPLSGNFPGSGKKGGDAYDWESGDDLYVAAHAVVREGICGCEELLIVLPVTVNAYIEWPGYASEAYFDVTISGDGILDGLHKGWCADSEDEIDVYPDPFDDETEVYPTICGDLESIPQIDYPLNLPKVNWLLNNIDTIPGGPFTVGDIQYAIWALLSGLPIPEHDALDSIEHYGDTGWRSLWPVEWNYNADRGNALATAADTHGDFTPDCGDIMVVVLIPPPELIGDVYVPQQAVLIEVPVPCCGGDMTAWAGIEGSDGPPESPPGEVDDDGYTFEFKGSDWAMYFPYTVE